MSALEDFIAAAAPRTGRGEESVSGAAQGDVEIPSNAVLWGRVVSTRQQYILVQVRGILIIMNSY